MALEDFKLKEILFKAKRADWRKLPKEEWWVEGYITQRKGSDGKVFESWIILDAYEQIGVLNMKSALVSETGFNCYQVDIGIICEYTGLTDKNGRKIFEGDIVVVNDEDGKFVIKWDSKDARFTMESKSLVTDFSAYWGYQTEVIGNVFDNPELLEEGD